MMNVTALVTFLNELDANNNREWFGQHKTRYEALRKDFEVLVQDVIERMGDFDPVMQQLQAKDCLFRIYRDLRFSKNKLPYKTTFSAAMAAGGKSSALPTYYFQINAHGQLWLAGGLYSPDKDQLARIRSAIDEQPERLSSVVEAQLFRATFGALDDERLRQVPRGYAQDHPAGELLRLKRFVASRSLDQSALESVDLPRCLAEHFQAMYPLIHYLRAVSV